MNLRRLLFLAVAAIPSVAQADFISFDELSPMTLITNQYAHVTFSSSAGANNYAHSTGVGNMLCTGTPVITCLQDTYLQFDGPVQNLSFLAVEPNFDGHDADFRIFQNGAFTATVQLFGLGGLGSKPVDLSAYSDITRLEIVNILNNPTLENGIGWDNFSFTPGSAAVPEPSTVVLMALGGVASMLRRRTKR